MDFIGGANKKRKLQIIDDFYWMKKIAYKVINNQAVFFLGAGFSLNFKLPSWVKFVISLIEKIVEELEKESIKLPDANSKIEDLNRIKTYLNKKKKKGVPNLDVMIDYVYSILDIDVRNIESNVELIELIKRIYINHFKVDARFLYNENANLDQLNYFKKVLNKVITTNYDNLLGGDFNKKIINNFSDIDQIDTIDKFYFPIHGNVDFLNKKNPWEFDEEHNFPLIDSFSSFQKFYSYEEGSKYDQFFQKLSKYCDDKKNILVFLGYSFEDKFITRGIYNEIIKSKEKSEIKVCALFDDKAEALSIYPHSNKMKYIKYNSLYKVHQTLFKNKDKSTRYQEFYNNFVAYIKENENTVINMSEDEFLIKEVVYSNKFNITDIWDYLRCSKSLTKLMPLLMQYYRVDNYIKCRETIRKKFKTLSEEEQLKIYKQKDQNKFIKFFFDFYEKDKLINRIVTKGNEGGASENDDDFWEY